MQIPHLLNSQGYQLIGCIIGKTKAEVYQPVDLTEQIDELLRRSRCARFPKQLDSIEIKGQTENSQTKEPCWPVLPVLPEKYYPKATKRLKEACLAYLGNRNLRGEESRFTALLDIFSTWLKDLAETQDMYEGYRLPTAQRLADRLNASMQNTKLQLSDKMIHRVLETLSALNQSPVNKMHREYSTLPKVSKTPVLLYEEEDFWELDRVRYLKAKVVHYIAKNLRVRDLIPTGNPDFIRAVSGQAYGSKVYSALQALVLEGTLGDIPRESASHLNFDSASVPGELLYQVREIPQHLPPVRPLFTPAEVADRIVWELLKNMRDHQVFPTPDKIVDVLPVPVGKTTFSRSLQRFQRQGFLLANPACTLTQNLANLPSLQKLNIPDAPMPKLLSSKLSALIKWTPRKNLEVEPMVLALIHQIPINEFMPPMEAIAQAAGSKSNSPTKRVYKQLVDAGILQLEKPKGYRIVSKKNLSAFFNNVELSSVEFERLLQLAQKISEREKTIYQNIAWLIAQKETTPPQRLTKKEVAFHMQAQGIPMKEGEVSQYLEAFEAFQLIKAQDYKKVGKIYVVINNTDPLAVCQFIYPESNFMPISQFKPEPMRRSVELNIDE